MGLVCASLAALAYVQPLYHRPRSSTAAWSSCNLVPCRMSEAESRLLAAAADLPEEEVVISSEQGPPTPLQHAVVEVLTHDEDVDYNNLLTPCDAPREPSSARALIDELQAILLALEGKVSEAVALVELAEQEAQQEAQRASLRASESYQAQRGLERVLACAEKRVADAGGARGDPDGGVGTNGAGLPRDRVARIPGARRHGWPVWPLRHHNNNPRPTRSAQPA